MADMIFVALILAFFALATLLVRACDRIIGPDIVPVDSDGLATSADPADPIELVA
jgi:hypothetical protein